MQSELVYMYLYPIPLLPLVPLMKSYIRIILLVLYCLYVMSKFVSESKFTYDKPDRPLSRFKRTCRHANIRVYIDTAVDVLISYASLLHINLDYIWLGIFPFITLAFIIALCHEELCGESRSKQHSSGAGEAHLSSTGTSASKDQEKGEAHLSSTGTSASKDQEKGEANLSGRGTSAAKDEEKETKSRLELEVIAAVPFWVLCAMGQFHQADQFAVSQFLQFLSSTLGSLTLMMARLVPTGVIPGLAPASELLHKASLVALLVTVHTVAAELLGEDVVMFCLPEYVPVLLWFSVHVDRGSSIITVDKIKRHKSGLVALGAVVAAAFAYLAASMDESGLSRCTKTLVSCGVSGFLIYYVVFMLCQWPGQAGTATTTSLKEAVELLQFWANVLLIAAAALMVLTSFAAARLGLPQPTVAALAKLFGEYSV